MDQDKVDRAMRDYRAEVAQAWKEHEKTVRAADIERAQRVDRAQKKRDEILAALGFKWGDEKCEWCENPFADGVNDPSKLCADHMDEFLGK